MKWFNQETDSKIAIDLYVAWTKRGWPCVAPSLALAEIANALLQLVRAGEVTQRDADEAVFELPRFMSLTEMTTSHARRALAIAHSVGSRAIYDFYYVALAEELGCELWTADARLWGAVRGIFPNIRLLGRDTV